MLIWGGNDAVIVVFSLSTVHNRSSPADTSTPPNQKSRVKKKVSKSSAYRRDLQGGENNNLWFCFITQETVRHKNRTHLVSFCHPAVRNNPAGKDLNCYSILKTVVGVQRSYSSAPPTWTRTCLEQSASISISGFLVFCLSSKRKVMCRKRQAKSPRFPFKALFSYYETL